MLTILLKFNDKLLKTIETDKAAITIGRNADNDIAIDNLSVSKRHATIRNSGGRYFIEDENSTNGTYLNEKLVTSEKLGHKDRLTVGKHTLEILFDKTYTDAAGGADNARDTMMLTTEKHKEMLKKQKQAKK
jgi:pSer/pThr/pTyr-binding forkhead associated (FHA) protein